MSDQIGASVQEEESGKKPKSPVKQILFDEAKTFVGIFVYLAIVFGLLSLHEWVVLSEEHISYRFYGLALINALVLAKIILVAEGFNFADRFEEKPLAYPILYKSLAFTILLVGAYFAEEVIIGMFHGKTAIQAVPNIGGGTIAGFLAVAVIMCIALIPFFAFREISRAFGEAKLHALVFTRGMKALRSSSGR